MTSFHEMKEREYIPNKTYIMMLAGGGLSLSKVLLTNLGDIKKLRSNKGPSVKFERLPKKFEIPEYKKDMKYNKSDAKYKRPTLWCNCRSKKIIALANKLGSYEKSDYDFAESAFEWCKRNLVLEIGEMNGVDKTLERGTGSCIHINNVFTALCRCAGLKARYKMFAAIESQSMYDEIYDDMMRQWYDALGYFSLEADIEVFLDGKWVVAHAGPTPERQAGMAVPITRIGEESIGTWFEALPGTMFWTESIPYGIGFTMKILMKIAPQTVETLNYNVVSQIKKGEKLLKEKGGEQEYDQEIRRRFKFKEPTVELKEHKSIVFED